jgi:membrane protein
MFPPLRLRSALTLGGLTVRELATRSWVLMVKNEILTRASAVAFYAMLALVPFLGLLLTIAVQLLPDLTGMTGERGAGNMTVEELQSTLKGVLAPEAFGVVEQTIKEIQKKPPVGLLSIGLLITIWLASSLFTAIIDAMNRIDGVEETRPFWKMRLTAIFMTLVQAVILVGALVAMAVGPLLIAKFGLSQSAALFATVTQWAALFVMVLLSFALTFYVGPDSDQRWEWITPGSLLGTMAFLLASYGFSLYVRHFGSYDKTYGSLGGVMVLMFWFWVSAVVLLAAGQMNQVIEQASPLGKNYGQKVDATEAPDYRAIKPQDAVVPKIPDPEAMVHAEASPLDSAVRPDFEAMKPKPSERR